jgi:hypothetical protein
VTPTPNRRVEASRSGLSAQEHKERDQQMSDDGPGAGTGDPRDADDHRVLARLVVESAEDIAAFGRRFAAADAVTDDERALLGWVLLRVEQVVEQILDELR